MDSSNWVKIYSSAQAYSSEIIKGLLISEDIQCFIINKTDSMHIHLSNGDHEVYVTKGDVLRAKHILQKNQL